MSNERYTEEQIKKAKAAKTPEELLKMAEENGIELTLEQAKGYYAMLNPKAGALSDEELENVAGGSCRTVTQEKAARAHKMMGTFR